VGGAILLALKLLWETPAIPPAQRTSNTQDSLKMEVIKPSSTKDPRRDAPRAGDDLGINGEPEQRLNGSGTQVPLQKQDGAKRNSRP